MGQLQSLVDGDRRTERYELRGDISSAFLGDLRASSRCEEVERPIKIPSLLWSFSHAYGKRETLDSIS